jgi:hypothetical protein
MPSRQPVPEEIVEKEFFEHARPSSLLKRFATVDEVAAERNSAFTARASELRVRAFLGPRVHKPAERH